MDGLSKKELVVGRDQLWGLGFSRTVKLFFQRSSWGSLVCLCFGEVPLSSLSLYCHLWDCDQLPQFALD